MEVTRVDDELSDWIREAKSLRELDMSWTQVGDVFLPLKGQNHDAHKFISEAYDFGAACVVSEKKIDNKKYESWN